MENFLINKKYYKQKRCRQKTRKKSNKLIRGKSEFKKAKNKKLNISNENK